MTLMVLGNPSEGVQKTGAEEVESGSTVLDVLVNMREV